jgi:CRP-like cAMP-binding protein
MDTSQLAALYSILKKEPAVRGELEVMLLVSFVQKFRFFRQLPNETCRKVCRYMGLQEVDKGERVVDQGDTTKIRHADAPDFFVIIQGRCEVVRWKDKPPYSEEQIASLNMGDTFGAESIMSGEKRNASVVARSYCRLFTCTAAQFKFAFDEVKDELTFVPELCINALCKDPADRTQHDLEELVRLARGSNFLQQFDKDICKEICRCCTYLKAERGTVICNQGDPAEALYIVLQGAVSVHISGPNGKSGPSAGGESKDAEKGGQPTDAEEAARLEREQELYGPAICELGLGDAFGEGSMISGQTRKATVISSAKVLFVVHA